MGAFGTHLKSDIGLQWISIRSLVMPKETHLCNFLVHLSKSVKGKHKAFCYFAHSQALFNYIICTFVTPLRCIICTFHDPSAMCELQDYIFNVHAKCYFQQLVSEISFLLCIFLCDLGIKKEHRDT